MKGKREIVAELSDTGGIIVQRYRSGDERKTTEIYGTVFYLICGACNE